MDEVTKVGDRGYVQPSERIDWHSRITVQPELVRIWEAAASDPSFLNTEDKARFLWLISELVYMYEGQYQIYKEGYFDDKAWHSKIDTLTELLKNPVLEEWWDKRIVAVGDEFREYVELRISSPGSWTHQPVGDYTPG